MYTSMYTSFFWTSGNYRGAAALYEQIIQEDPDGLSHHEVD